MTDDAFDFDTEYLMPNSLLPEVVRFEHAQHDDEVSPTLVDYLGNITEVFRITLLDIISFPDMGSSSALHSSMYLHDRRHANHHLCSPKSDIAGSHHELWDKYSEETENKYVDLLQIKTNLNAPDTFEAIGQGNLGMFPGDRPDYYFHGASYPAQSPHFELGEVIGTLPAVMILYGVLSCPLEEQLRGLMPR
ncbi:hypothetical protein Micbo1qcDRAFT_173214 [Microdochium bolleyi]|uniref:Uncharacterized protein n=1 Tax=Microdochium bolleyi TaxID=196109 RepID=A0A136JB90_9PEZI|nr:hypothetical protein Micbo1qcDRAFT_173214 [Microdochium bolleyi]